MNEKHFIEALDSVGKEDSDIDNDGKSNTTSDKYLLKRRKIRGAVINARKMKEEFIPEPESFYDWRSTVSEDIAAAIEDNNTKKIEAKNVDNYTKNKNGKRVVTINPTVNFREEVESLGGEVLSTVDINEMSEVAADYFINLGLNEVGVDVVMEELGDEEFCEWVIDIMEEAVLLEARAAKKRKGGPSYEEVKASIEAKEKAKKSAPRKVAVKMAKVEQEKRTRPPGQERIIRGAQQVLQKANSPETKKAVAKSVANTLARGALSAWEGHKAAMQSKKEGKGLMHQIGKGAAATATSFLKKGTAHLKEYIEYLENEGYDLSEITLQDLYEQLDSLDEKAVSQQQQKLFGLALAVKRGQKPKSEVSKGVKDLVRSLPEKEIRKFAKTKHTSLPKEVKEGLTFSDLRRFIGE